MKESEYMFLPEVNNYEDFEIEQNEEREVVGNSPCPCCGYITIPNNGDALAYICPVCFWEVDLFIKADDEISDQNYGLTLKEARNNYIKFGAVLPRFKENCRKPKDYEYQKLDR